MRAARALIVLVPRSYNYACKHGSYDRLRPASCSTIHRQVVLSDGRHFLHGECNPDLSNLVHNHIIAQNAVLRVSRFSMSARGDRRVCLLSEARCWRRRLARRHRRALPVNIVCLLNVIGPSASKGQELVEGKIVGSHRDSVDRGRQHHAKRSRLAAS